MDQIKAHFFGSHAEWNKYSVIPRGLGFMELLDMPHDRHLLTDKINEDFTDNTNHNEYEDDDDDGDAVDSAGMNEFGDYQAEI
jgi:hypothetical protein